MSKCSTYHLCAVPECKNNSVKTPDKLWIPVPTDINMRKTWFKVARRGPELLSGKTRLYFCEDHFDEDSLQTENEINVFCPKCNTEVSHTTEGIQEDQTKLLIANVYHYFEREYEELKTIYGDLDLTPLLKFCQRTALATGVSETTVLQILKEEEGRNADKRQQPPVKRRKRSRQMDRAQTAVVKIEPEYYNAEPEIYFPAAVKVEPSDIELHTEQAQTDPISLHVKTEPQSDVVDDTNETLALIEPAGTKRKARVIPRSDVTPTRQHPRGDSSTAAAASSVRVKVKEEVDESSLFGDTEIKVEEIEIHEEGVG